MSQFIAHGNRYATSRYSDDELYICAYDNSVCVIGLSPRHPIRLARTQQETALKHQTQSTGHAPPSATSASVSASSSSAFASLKITFPATDVVKGKRKRGAIWLQVGDELCNISFCGVSSVIRCPVHGKLLEQNPLLQSDPSLLLSDPEWSGYVCLVLASNVQMDVIHRIHDDEENDLWSARPKLTDEEDEKTEGVTATQQSKQDGAEDNDPTNNSMNISSKQVNGKGEDSQAAGSSSLPSSTLSRISGGFGSHVDRQHHAAKTASNTKLLTPRQWREWHKAKCESKIAEEKQSVNPAKQSANLKDERSNTTNSNDDTMKQD